jgi:hypothetical protein
MTINNVWKNEPCYVVGCGTSLRGFDFNNLNGKHSIGINYAVEDYEFEWLLYVNNLDGLSYDLNKFPGYIFAHQSTQFYREDRIFKFKAIDNNGEPSLRIEDGLYNCYLSGIAATNLAIISGANPIYLLGLDCGGGTKEDKHYRQIFNGHVDSVAKYERGAQYFEKFFLWKDRIINLSLISNIKVFAKQDWRDHFA